jgi:hypothetical protein
MDDQLNMTFQNVMEEDMSILQVEEVITSSTRGPKCCQRYVKRDHEAAHFRL